MKKRRAVYALSLCALMTAFAAAAAQISIPITVIPFTLSVMAVMLCGLLLPPGYAVLSMLCYIALGAMGLPVFAGFSGGVAVLFAKTGGFIFSYPLMALLISYLARKTRLPKTLICLLSLPVCYGLGAGYFAFVTARTVREALSLAVLPFIPFDIVKCFLAALCHRLIEKAVKKP